MKLTHAQTIATLLAGNGLLDEPDEILYVMLEEGATEEYVRQYATSIDELIGEMNGVLPEDERICLPQSLIEEAEEAIVEYKK